MVVNGVSFDEGGEVDFFFFYSILFYRDQFVLQPDGYGRIVGRLKEMIIRGGENIFPKEIEDFINNHEAVIETHVRYRISRTDSFKTLFINNILSCFPYRS